MKVSKDLIIVTGGAGFIGSNIVKALNKAGEENILIVDRLGKADKWKNLVDLKFLDYEHKDDFLVKLERGMFDHGIWAVFHMGACTRPLKKTRTTSWKTTTGFPAGWPRGTRGEKGLRFIYASSAATYGDGGHGYSDDHESVPSLRPLNMYGYSKQIFDLWALNTGFLRKCCGPQIL